MISLQFDKFLSACESEVADRNSNDYEDDNVQDVVWNFFYPFLRKRGMEECVLISCDVIYKNNTGKNGKASMSEKEFSMTLKENKDMTIEECAKKLVDLATNKARGDLML